MRQYFCAVRRINKIINREPDDNNVLNNLAVRLGRRLQWAGPYAIFLQMTLIGLAALSISRLALVGWQWDRVSATGMVASVFLQGVRADLILLGYFTVIPIVFLAPLTWALSERTLRVIFTSWATVVLVLIVFLEVSSPQFITQFDVRPNRLFIEYLLNPKEVISMLWNGFRFTVIAGIGASILLGAAIFYVLRVASGSAVAWPAKRLWLSWPLVFLLVCVQIRSTTAHRPANPALFALTGDAMVNSLIINSPWAVLDALMSMRKEANSSEIYGPFPREKVFATVKSAPWLKDAEFTSTELPTLHRQQAVVKRDRPLNLVIVLEESLGATFVESLGGLPVTPELEKLKNDGWWFEQLYATGTRSVRGIEAVVAGYAPTPARSVVKLSMAQQNFYTLALGLGKEGYTTEFVYGGEAHFDNMRSFFTGNGFQRVVDRSDMKPVFEGSWGASDEDLFNKSLERLKTLHKEGKPFFSLIFSSSNHQPFEFPDGRIELHDSPKQTVNNAVKYADYALGNFIREAKKQDYWKDTVFLIVADHDTRVYGNSLVPIKKFHIPGLILGADIQPKRIATIASQIDLGPTLLSLMGVSSEHPMIGRDLARDSDSPGRALIQFDKHFAWLQGRTATILRPGKDALLADYDAASGDVTISATAPSPAQVDTAMSHVILPSLLYREQRYKLAK